MRPPSIARALLVAAAGEQRAEYVAGDLEEEFVQRCEIRDRAAASRWYARQVLRSVAPLLWMRLQSRDLPRRALGALVCVAAPLLLLDRLWSFVYSQIPLKDGIGRAPEFLMVNMIAACAGAAAAEATGASHRASKSGALTIAAATGFALWASAGDAPALYEAALLLGVTASGLLARVWRRAQ